MKQGNLYLIPTPLADDTLATFPPYIKNVIVETNIYVVENIKTARKVHKIYL